MKRMIIVGIMALAGCSKTTQPDPVYVEVKVPVPVPCKTAELSKPAFAVNQLPIGASIDQQMRALRAERHQRIGYEKELEAAIYACL
ncbi:hypothetical protein [Pectobacterium odoriferum]|uniref:hypothetical protein n=1 Tax=Pectobacterium odoriferum TaxID=78398 RepID=UPI000502FB3E|nr:hypothetical protein [Pectobacterium odoriferum]KGA26218.1 lipoprotein [Pectobacterium odoriferum]